MKTIDLTVRPRTDIGKAANKALRAEGHIPAVVYDNSEAIHVSANVKELKSVLYTKDTYIVNLNIEGQSTLQAIVREAQFHPVTEQVLHVDFLRVTEDRKVILELPVELEGTPIGVRAGGKLTTKLRKIKVKGIPIQLPEAIMVDVSELALGSTIKVKDAKTEGLEVITSAQTGVASVEIPRALRSAGAADEAQAEAEAAEGGEGGEE